MSPVEVARGPRLLTYEGRPIPWDDARGTAGMWLFIVTETFLFVSLFFGYFYFGSLARTAWPPEPPKVGMALLMLGVLLASSLVLHLGERALQRGGRGVARGAIAVTMLLGIAFLVIQGLEYKERLKTVSPTADVYGSIFFTITGFHAAHLCLGLLMLAFALVVPRLEPASHPPHRSLKNASLYWHFVDAVWVVIVAILYVAPRLRLRG